MKRKSAYFALSEELLGEIQGKADKVGMTRASYLKMLVLRGLEK